MIRDTARAYAQDKLACRRVTKAYLEKKVDRDIFHEIGAVLGLIGHYRCRRYAALKALNASYVGLRPSWRAKIGARRFRLSFDEFGALPSRVYAPIYALWRREPAEENLPKLATGEWSAASAGLAEPGRRPDPGGMKTRGRGRRRRLSAHRYQDVDFQRADRRRIRGVAKSAEHNQTISALHS